jgi:hypothetical protein
MICWRMTEHLGLGGSRLGVGFKLGLRSNVRVREGLGEIQTTIRNKKYRTNQNIQE